VKFFASRMTPENLIALGIALIAAGKLAQQRQAAIADALAHVQVGVDKLSD
jgi:hypothetical protein